MDLMKEALLYEKLPGNQVRCDVCGHHCLIAAGKRGRCRVRANVDGTLFALNYGLCASAAIDPIEKKPLYHFLPGSDVYSFAAIGCNMRCPWCQNHEISQSWTEDDLIIGQPVSPEEHVKRALKFDCPSIAYTYSEPTVFLEYALATMKSAKKHGLKNVWVSNGFMSAEATRLIASYLDAANIDVKGPDDAFYAKYTGGDLKTVIDNIKILQEAKVHVEITTLLIPGLNDAKNQLEKLIKTIVTELGTDVPWHISRFFPAWKMSEATVTPLASLRLAETLGRTVGIKHIHLGNV